MGLTVSNVCQAAYQTAFDTDTFVKLSKRISVFVPGIIAAMYHNICCMYTDLKSIPEGPKAVFDTFYGKTKIDTKLGKFIGEGRLRNILSFALKAENIVENAAWPLVAIISLFAIPYIVVPALSINLFLGIGFGALSLVALYGVTRLTYKLWDDLGSGRNTEIRVKHLFALAATVACLGYAVLSFVPTITLWAGYKMVANIAVLTSVAFGALSLFCKKLDKLDHP